MKKILKFIGIILGILLFLGITSYLIWFHNSEEHVLKLQASKVYSPEKSNSHLIANANIIDIKTGKVLKNQNLIIQNGIFKQIFEGQVSDSLKNYYEMVDAENRYLMPGLIDMHSHLNSGGLIPPEETTRTMALEQFARYGVSTVFTLGGHGFNQDITAKLIEKQQKHEIVAPMIFSAGDILTSQGGYPIPFLSKMLGIAADKINLEEQGIMEITKTTDLDAIFSKKRSLGLNGIKVMVESRLGGATTESRLSNELLKKITQLAPEYNLPVFAHVTNQTDFTAAIEMGVDVIAHNVAADSLKNAKAQFKKMVEDSIYVIPTLLMSYRSQLLQTTEMLDDSFYLQYSSERTNRSFDNIIIRKMMVKNMGTDAEAKKQLAIYNFSQLYKAGVLVMMGTDAGNATMFPGYSAHKELEFMADAGMPAAEVLRAATIVPANFLKIGEKTGTIAVGKVASFIMLGKNPLEDVSNTQSIERVMLEGYWIE